MTRLNKTIREQIVDNAIDKAGVNTRNADLIRRRAELADACRLIAIGGVEKEHEILKEFKKLEKSYKTSSDFIKVPEPKLVEDYEIQVSFGGMVTRLHYSGRIDGQKDTYKSPAPYCGGLKPNVLLPVDHNLTDEFTSIESEQKVVNDLRETVRVNVQAVVASVNTVKKLIEVWPEGAELIPADCDKPVVNLPSVDVQQLNAMVGVPSE